MASETIPRDRENLEQQVCVVQAAVLLSYERERGLIDREFALLLQMLAPRIHHLINVYRLTDMLEDAQQVCSIAIWRALENYDPKRARFATHATWQLRGELQSLRHRVRLDQRQSARTAGITTVALESLIDEHGQPFEVTDTSALNRTEAGASEAMALGVLGGMLDSLGSPERERAIVVGHLLDREPVSNGFGLTREQRRQIIRRTWRSCAKVVGTRRTDLSSSPSDASIIDPVCDASVPE